MFKDIDRAARARKVRVLSTGVNPGFAMDALALALTAPCARVDRVAVTRVVDAGTRRLPLQRKVGAGLNLNQFRRAMTEGSVRHVGLLESVHMIAAGLGWKLDRVEETLEPAIAPRTSTPSTCASRRGPPPASGRRRAATAAASWPSPWTSRCTWPRSRRATTSSSTASRPST
jgi:4-hydroxy-tetrahydrodipicolinate reductase